MLPITMDRDMTIAAMAEVMKNSMAGLGFSVNHLPMKSRLNGRRK